MFPTFRKFGDLLDRIDVGGWLLLALGVFIISLTVLAPAYLDVAKLQAQNDVLHRQASLLQLREQNYVAFNRAVERGDPMLIQRLSVQQLHYKPVGSEPMDPGSFEPANKSIDGWMNPRLDALPLSTLAPPNTRLTRLLTGPPRPWVLAFGGWLVLLGLLLNPRMPTDAPETKSSVEEGTTDPLSARSEAGDGFIAETQPVQSVSVPLPAIDEQLSSVTEASPAAISIEFSTPQAAPVVDEAAAFPTAAEAAINPMVVTDSVPQPKPKPEPEVIPPLFPL